MTNTSAKAYHEIKEDGTLNAGQYRVWNYLACYYGKTGEEIDAACGKSGHKRLNELRILGKVEHCGTTKSAVTGKIVHKWRITAQGALPYPQERKPTRKQLLAELSAYRDKYGPLHVVHYFYTLPNSTIPSPYYQSIEAVKNALGWRSCCHIWTGTYRADTSGGIT